MSAVPYLSYGGGGGRGSGSGGGHSGDEAVDRLSALPDDLIGRILIFLDTDEGARTAVLSRRMRHVWSSTPLNLDDRRFSGASDLVSCLQYILGATAGHQSLVSRVSFRRLRSSTLFGALGDWFKKPIFGSLQELVLSFPGERARLPQAVLQFTSLRALDLWNCVVHGTMLNFPHLVSLRLWNVCISETILSGLISNATYLHTLVLKSNGGYARLSLSLSYLHCLILSVNPLLWEDEEQLQNLYLHNSPSLDRLLVDIVGTAHPLSITLSKTSIPRIFGSFGTGCSNLQIGSAKIEGIFVRSLDLAQTWARVRILDIQVDEEAIGGFKSCLQLFPCLQTLHIMLGYFGNRVDLPNLLSDSDDQCDCISFSLKTVVLRSYMGLSDETAFARTLGESAKALQLLAFETEFSKTADWLKRQRYTLNFDGRASETAQFQFMSACEARCSYSLDDQIQAKDPFFLRYAEPYHVLKAQSPEHLLQEEFIVTSLTVLHQERRLQQLDPSITFDEVSRIRAHSENSDTHLHLDVATWVYRMSIGDRFVVTFASTLNLDGTPDGGCFTRDSSITLSKFEHCMSGKIYNIVKENSSCNPTVEIYASFGGRQMRMKGNHTLSARFKKGQPIFLLMCKCKSLSEYQGQ